MVSTDGALHEERTFFFPELLRFPEGLQCSLCDRRCVTDSTMPVHHVCKNAKSQGAPLSCSRGGPVFFTLVLMECKLLKRDRILLPVSSVLQGAHSSALPQGAP